MVISLIDNYQKSYRGIAGLSRFACKTYSTDR